MTLLEKNSQFSTITPQFDLGKNSTIHEDSLANSALDLEGIKGPEFDLGVDSTLQQDSLLSLDYDLEGNPGPLFDFGVDSSFHSLISLFSSEFNFDGTEGPEFDLGVNSALHTDSITNIPFSYNGNFFPLSYDLNGNEGPQFDLGVDSTLQQDSILASNLEGPSSLLSFEGNQPEFFNFGKEATQDRENPIFDTIHEESLLAPHRDPNNDLDLNGEKGIFQTSTELRDKMNRRSLNQVPMTPSRYADLNNSHVPVAPPDGAPVPNSLLFHGMNKPTKFQGKQIKGLDLHEHLLNNGYTYNHGLNQTTILNNKSGITGGQLDLNGQTPNSYVDKMSTFGVLGLENLNTI